MRTTRVQRHMIITRRALHFNDAEPRRTHYDEHRTVDKARRRIFSAAPVCTIPLEIVSTIHSLKRIERQQRFSVT